MERDDGGWCDPCGKSCCLLIIFQTQTTHGLDFEPWVNQKRIYMYKNSMSFYYHHLFNWVLKAKNESIYTHTIIKKKTGEFILFGKCNSW